MPIPSTVSDLSATAASNYPTGAESVGPSLDDYLRSHAAIIRQVYDEHETDLAAKANTSSLSSYVTTASLAASSGSSLAGFIQSGAGAVATTVQAKLRESVSVKDFGAVGDGVTDDTAAIVAAKAYAISRLPFALVFPAGTYKYSSLGNLAYSGLSIVGENDSAILKCTASGVALTVDAFAAGLTGNDATAPFVQNMNILGITIEGNSGTTKIIDAQGVARSTWKINARNAEPTSSIAYHLKGVMLSDLDLKCSTDYNSMSSVPYEGLRLDEGRRVGISVGNSSNNTIRHYMEGLSIGTRLTAADQNIFVGGSPESNSVYGLLVNAGCRYNIFIGTGFENPSSTADVADSGIQTQYLNCYSSKKFNIQGRQIKVSGGYFERIEIDPLSARNKLENLTINHWATGAGGIVDNGVGTESKDIYDADLGAFINDIKPRFLAYAPATVTNQTGNGAQATIGFSEVFDDGGNFSTNTFTAPVTGRYQLSTTVSLDSLSTAATLTTLRIVTSNRTYLTQEGINPKAGGLQDSISMVVVADMDAGDTATVTIQVDGMAGNTVSIVGNAATMWTTFSGCKV